MVNNNDKIKKLKKLKITNDMFENPDDPLNNNEIIELKNLLKDELKKSDLLSSDFSMMMSNSEKKLNEKNFVGITNFIAKYPYHNEEDNKNFQKYIRDIIYKKDKKIIKLFPQINHYFVDAITENNRCIKKILNLDFNNTCENKDDAIKNDHICCFEYNLQDKFEISDVDFLLACQFGSLNIIKYMINKGYVYTHNNDSPMKNACKFLELVKYLDSKNFKKCDIYYVCENGCVDVVDYLRENGTILSPYCPHKIYENGNIEMLKYLITNGVNMNSNMLESALVNDQLDMAKYIISTGKKNISLYGMENILITSNLDIIKFLYEKKYKFPENAIELVVVGKDKNSDILQKVKFLLEKNFDCGYGAIDKASQNKHFDVVLYLNAKNKNYSNITIQNLKHHNREDIIQILNKNNKKITGRQKILYIFMFFIVVFVLLHLFGYLNIEISISLILLAFACIGVILSRNIRYIL